MQLQNLPYLFVAYTLVWLVLFGYLFVIAAQVRAVRRDLDQLRAQLAAARPPHDGD